MFLRKNFITLLSENLGDSEVINNLIKHRLTFLKDVLASSDEELIKKVLEECNPFYENLKEALAKPQYLRSFHYPSKENLHYLPLDEILEYSADAVLLRVLNPYVVYDKKREILKEESLWLEGFLNQLPLDFQSYKQRRIVSDLKGLTIAQQQELILAAGSCNTFDAARFTSLFAYIALRRELFNSNFIDVLCNSIQPKAFSILFSEIQKLDIPIKKYILNMLDDRNNSILHLACKFGRADIVETLLQVAQENSDYKALHPTYVNADGNTAFHLACMSYCWQIADLNSVKTRKIGIDPEALHNAIIRSHQSVPPHLYEQIVATHETDRGSDKKVERVYFHINQLPGLIDLFIKAGMNIYQFNKNNQTALHLAAQHLKDANLFDALFAHPLMRRAIDAVNAFGQTPLHTAITEKNIVAMVALVKHGAGLKNVFVSDKLSDLFWHASQSKLNDSELKYLYEHGFFVGFDDSIVRDELQLIQRFNVKLAPYFAGMRLPNIFDPKDLAADFELDSFINSLRENNSFQHFKDNFIRLLFRQYFNKKPILSAEQQAQIKFLLKQIAFLDHCSPKTDRVTQEKIPLKLPDLTSLAITQLSIHLHLFADDQSKYLMSLQEQIKPYHPHATPFHRFKKQFKKSKKNLQGKIQFIDAHLDERDSCWSVNNIFYVIIVSAMLFIAVLAAIVTIITTRLKDNFIWPPFFLTLAGLLMSVLMATCCLAQQSNSKPLFNISDEIAEMQTTCTLLHHAIYKQMHVLNALKSDEIKFLTHLRLFQDYLNIMPNQITADQKQLLAQATKHIERILIDLHVMQRYINQADLTLESPPKPTRHNCWQSVLHFFGNTKQPSNSFVDYSPEITPLLSNNRH